MPFKFNPITGKLDLVESAPLPPVPDETTFVTDAGNALSVNDSINVFGGANINTAGAGDTVTIALDTDVVTNSYATDTLATNVKIEDNTITAGGTDANVDIGLVTKGDGGVYTPNNLTVGQSSSVTSIPYLGGNLDVAMLIDTEGVADLGGVVENRHGNVAGFGAHHILARSRGTHVAPTTILSNDTIGRFASFGFDGTEYVEATEMTTLATGTIAAGKVPGQFVFSTADNVTGALQTAMTIDNGQTTTVPRLVGTANITARFATPNLTSVTIVPNFTYTNAFSTVFESANQSMLSGEYYGAASTAIGTASTILFSRALGTKASPTGITGTSASNNVLLGQIRFVKLTGINTQYSNAMTISSYANETTGGMLNFESQSFTEQGFRLDGNNTKFFLTGGIVQHSNFQVSPTVGIGPSILWPDRFIVGGDVNYLTRNVMATTLHNNNGLQIACIGAVKGGQLFLSRAGGTATARTVVAINDDLGSITWGGLALNTDSGPREAAIIVAEVDAAIATTYVPGRLVFKTVTSTGTVTEAMRIDSGQTTTVPRLVGTANITARFATPNLTTPTEDITYTNAFSTVFESANQSSLGAEYYGPASAANGTGSTIVMYRSLGTKASPLPITGTAASDRVLIGQIRFSALKTGPTNRSSMAISCYDNATSNGACLNIIGSSNNSTGFQFNTLDMQLFTSGAFIQHTAFNTNPTSPVSPLRPLRFVIGGDLNYTGRNIMASNTASNQGLHIACAGATNTGGQLFLSRARGSFPFSVNAVSLNDDLGSVNWGGQASTNANGPIQAAQISAKCDGTVTSSIVPARLVFSTITSTGTLNDGMIIDSAQRITQPLQPSFSASLSADVVNETGDGTAYTIAFDTEQYDQGANFAANTFTAPIAGKYRFAYTISVDDLAVGHTKLELSVGGRVVERCNPYAIADSDGFCLLSGMVDLSLAAAATVTMVVTVSGSTKTVTVKGTTSSGTFLSGQLQV